MKNLNLIAILLLSNVAAAQAGTPFKHPVEIDCKPSRAISVNLPDGIVEEKDYNRKVSHKFEYVENGKYKFKSGYGTFSSKLTNQDAILNLFSGAVTYSIDIYGGRYVVASSQAAVFLPDKTIVGGPAYGTLVEGTCNIRWK